VTISDVFLPQNPGLYRASFLFIVLGLHVNNPCFTLVKNYFLSMIANGIIMNAIWMFVLRAASIWYLPIFFLTLPSLFINFNDLIFLFYFSLNFISLVTTGF
jgi:hypothetical protein